MTGNDYDIILIGGSSGSIPILLRIIEALPGNCSIPVVIVVHRMKNVQSDLKNVLSHSRVIIEPEDKEAIRNGCIYLAPQNYHLLIEDNFTFSMDYSELVNYSRPSIDVTFAAAASAYGARAMAILLSGANSDGAEGINRVIQNGGKGIVLDPSVTEYPSMPEAAIKKNAAVEIQTQPQIVSTLLATVRYT